MIKGTFTPTAPPLTPLELRSPVPHPNAPDTAVLICHWNWANFSRPEQNLHRMLRQLRTMRIPVFGIEAVHKHQAVTTGLGGWRQVHANDRQILFQKEAMLNALVPTLPKQYTKLIWLDHDLWFDDPDWFVKTAKLLDTFKVVQPFDRAVWYNERGVQVLESPGSFSEPTKIPGQAHPGFAMAARRELWDNGGLFSRLILGSGDTVFARSAVGQPITTQEKRIRLWEILEYPHIDACLAPWHAQVAQWVAGEFGFLPGAVHHEWHGARVNRQYAKRLDVYCLYDDAKHITIADNGLLTWTPTAPTEAVCRASDYFLERKEDG